MNDYSGRVSVPANQIFAASKLTYMKVGQVNAGNSINIENMAPGTYTVQFSFAQLPAVGSGLAVPNVWAEIVWTLGGQQQRRVVSIIPGTSLTGQCEGLTVTLFDKYSVLGSESSVNTPYVIQATVSSGCRPVVNQPPYLMTYNNQEIEVATPLEFDIPSDAGVISLFPCVAVGDVAATAVTFELTQLRGAIPVSRTDAYGANNWIPIAPSATKVRVRYLDAGSGAVGSVNLFWGIQG